MLGCFLDASKAFDLVNHGVLFCKLFDRGLPLSVLRFLSSWYETQKMSVRWSHSFSDPFSVSNGVRQGSVLSPVYSLSIWMNCWRCWVTVVLVVTGVVLSLVHCVMPMTLSCWLHVPQL